MKENQDEYLFRYGIVARENDSENPDFDLYECCKDYPICRYIHESKNFYSRSDIELMSQKLGYSVWDNIGGSENCQCKWKSFIVTKK